MADTTDESPRPTQPATIDPGVGIARAGDPIRCSMSDSFRQWMSRCGGSVAITTYQAGKLALVGWDGTQVTLLLRDFSKPMGLAKRGRSLALATRDQVLLLADAPLLARDFTPQRPGRHDALYLPRAAFFTGELNVHDVALGGNENSTDVGDLWMVNTRFSCLASPSGSHSFTPRWTPSFVSELVPEDRCHLNGLAMGDDGQPLYVTALGATNSAGAWREHKETGGVAVHVPSGETTLRELCMPHSPRWREGRLWFLNSGAGELCVAGASSGRHEVVCALSGYLRGLCFVGPHALVGLCQIRERHTFGGLPVQARNPHLLCGVAVVDLATGRQEAMLEFTAGCQELYDVQFLPNLRRPMVLSPRNLEEAPDRQAFTAPDFSYWALRLAKETTDA